MKKYSKMRIVVFAMVLMLMQCIVLPIMTQEISASDDVYLNWKWSTDMDQEYKYIEIEKGATFYIGDYVSIMDGLDMGDASSFSKVKYSSGNKNVIAVNSKGLLKAKKTGSATIKIKYKGKAISNIL